MAVLARVDNPILWQEYTHQERSGARWLRWGHSFGILGIGSAVVYVLFTLSHIDAPTRELALYVIWMVHASTAIRATVAGANTISREHVGQTWDALVLTGVSARRILLGKWRAALWRVRGWALALGVVRLAMLPIFVLALVNRFVYFNIGVYGSSYNSGYLSFANFTLVPSAAVLSVVMTVVLTILDVLCCTALGLAASAVLRRGSLAGLAAILIRFAPVITFAAFTRHEIGTFSWRWWNFTVFALADGGTSPILRLVLPLMPWTQDQHLQAVPGVVLSAVLLGTMLILGLVVAIVAIRLTGALPHRRS